MNTEYEPTEEIAKKVLETVDHGLVKGLGKPVEGKMCVEAAVCFAFGLPHGDKPPCVGTTVRSFKIALNDCEWPSNEDRTKGMRELAIAQLGSDTIDQQKFLELVGLKCITRILPVIFENALAEDSGKEFAPEDKKLKAIIKKLKAVKTYKNAKEVADEAWNMYYAYAYAYAYASASASAYAYASASASAYAYAYAYAYASASASASAYASAYAKNNPIFSLKILNMTAQAGLEALKELKSPGCQWLYLCK